MSTANVDTVSNALAQTTIQPNPADDAAHSLAAEEGRRLYIGNLAYSTTEDQLKDFFKAYNVESVSIPTNPRTNRAVGYAFVDVKTKDEAEKAIGELSGKEVLDRKVSVQYARKPGTTAPGATGGQSGGEGPNGDRGNKRGRGGMRGRGGRGRGGRRRSTRGEGEEEAPVTSGDAAENSDAAKAEALKAKKKKGPPEDGVPSKTKVMVANLPYELGEEKLKELFAAYQPESAKIALRPIPRFMVRKLQARGEARKGRGFGFVTLGSEEMQKKAVDEMNGKVVEGREIAVKVAIDNPKLEGEEGEEHEGEDGAAAATDAGAAANGVKEEAKATA